jgi:ATP-dependent Clp protease ATP-binding subunit ClpX
VGGRRDGYNPPMTAPPSPAQIAAALEKRVLGQKEAVREIAVALSKKVAGLSVGNVLLIGSSGSGKTTLMRAVEDLLAANPALALRSTAIRVHANVLAEEAELGRPGEKLLTRLLERAREQLGAEAPLERLLEQATHGLVFVDEVDKIRSQVGGRPSVAGIRAQESLLTLVENESVPFTLPGWAGGGQVRLDSSGLLFVCAGAFEGLYDAVYDRVTVGKDQGALRPVTVVDESGRAHEELQFSLRDWLRTEDLFEYGISPQFLSRFDAVVLLEPLDAPALLRILTTSPDSPLRQSQAFFASFGLRLEVTPEAARRIAGEAARKPRLGARALKEVVRRVVSPLEFDPRATADAGTVRVDEALVDAALARHRSPDGASSHTAGWDQAFRG